MNNASKERGSSIAVTTGNEIHTACRRNICDRRRIDKEKNAQRKLGQKETVAASPHQIFSSTLLFVEELPILWSSSEIMQDHKS